MSRPNRTAREMLIGGCIGWMTLLTSAFSFFSYGTSSLYLPNERTWAVCVFAFGALGALTASYTHPAHRSGNQQTAPDAGIRALRFYCGGLVALFLYTSDLGILSYIALIIGSFCYGCTAAFIFISLVAERLEAGTHQASKYIFTSGAAAIILFIGLAGLSSVLFAQNVLPLAMSILVLGIACIRSSCRHPHHDERERDMTRTGSPTLKDAIHDQRKPIIGLMLLFATATIHWEIGELRAFEHSDGVSFAHQGFLMFGPHWTTFLLMTLASFTVAACIYDSNHNWVHPRTLSKIVFYGMGIAFFTPAILGLGSTNVLGVAQTAAFVYLAFLAVTSIEAGSSPVFSIVAVGCAVIAGVFGLAISWLLAPLVSYDEIRLISLIILTMYLVMAAPEFLFKAQSATLSQGSIETADPIAKACSALGGRYGLSARECEVLELAARGYSAAAIGQSLYIAEGTAKAHLKHLYAKMGIHTRQQLIELVESERS